MLRAARPKDYDALVAVIDDWWGRPVRAALPRLFLDHFWATSLVAQAPEGSLRGFLIGFDSPSAPAESYIHFAGVAPPARGTGLGRLLYAAFTDRARAAGRSVVRAVTSPANAPSIAFHRALGFTVTGPVEHHHGPGTPMVLFELRLTAGDPWDRGGNDPGGT